MTSFAGTWTSTPVKELQRGDLVQWHSEPGQVLDEPLVGEDDRTAFRLALPSRIRPVSAILPGDWVLMVQRPGLPSA